MFGELTHGTDGNDDIRKNIVIYVKNIALFLVAFLLLYFSVRRLIPEDLFSSALYYDGLGLQKVFQQPAMLVDDPLSVFIMTAVMGFTFPSVSAAAFAVGFMLFLVQVWAGYKASVAGGYTSKSETLLGFISNIYNRQDKFDAKTLNWSKVNWLLAWLLIAFTDTFTDISYRSGGEASLVIESIFISILVYNILSEWAMLTGLIGVMNYGYIVLTDTVPVIYHSVMIVVDEVRKIRAQIESGDVPLPTRGDNRNENPRNKNQNHPKNRGGDPRGGGHNNQQQSRKPRPGDNQRPPMDTRGGRQSNVTIVDMDD